MYELVIGRKVYPVPDLRTASRLFAAARDAAMEGASDMPPVHVRLNGKRWGYISYNGKVWQGTPQAWTSGAVPAFDPYVEA